MIARIGWTIRTQIVSGMLVVLAFLASASLLIDPPRHRRERLQTERTRLVGAADMVALGVAVGMRSTDLSTVARAIDWVKRDSSFIYASVLSPDGELFAEYNPRALAAPPQIESLRDSLVREEGQTLSVAVPIVDDERVLGRLVLRMSLEAAEQKIAADRNSTLLMLAVVSLLAALIGSILAHRIAGPLTRLRDATEHLSKGEYDLAVPETGTIEARALGRAFNLMVHRTRDAMQALTAQAGELAESRDAALAAARAKSLFLATMSHEIRTPMTGVLGMLDLLMRTSLSDRQFSFSRSARESAEALLVVIDDILDFSKIEAGKLQPEHVSFSPRKVAEDVATLLAERAHRKGVQMVCDVAHDVPPQVIGDPTRLRQILLNLGGNAVKFTTQGDVTIQTSASMAQDGACVLAFEVRDTGIGIAPDGVERLFQPFTQADTSTARRFGGTGLGLSIVRHLVTMMHGDIGVRSTVGVGSTFHFTIRVPLDLAGEHATEPTCTGIRVVVVAAHEGTRQVVARLIREGGGVAVEASDFDEGLGIVRRAGGADAFHVMLLDAPIVARLSCPPVETVRATRGLAGLAVAVMMQLTDDPATPQLSGGEVDVHLLKPVRRSDLLRTVRRLHRGHHTGEHESMVVPEHSEPTSVTGLRVLVAEDNPVNQQIARLVLEGLGYAVSVANNGFEAVAQVSHQHFDLVLMDCQMPEMDGFEATRMIRALSGDRARVPIIALTANAIAGDREQCLVAGMDDYLTKPYNRAQLEAMLSRHVQQNGGAANAVESTLAPTTRTRSADPPDSAIDLTRLREIVGNDAAKSSRLLERFATDGDGILRELSVSARAHDWPAAQRLAHRLYGASAGVGARAVAETCRSIEERARQNDGVEVERLIEALHAQFADARR